MLNQPNEVMRNEDGEPIYQDQKLKYYTWQKLYLKNRGAELTESILSCLVDRNSDVYSERNKKGSINDGDDILFHACHVLISAVWPDLTNDSHEIYKKYKSMPT